MAVQILLDEKIFALHWPYYSCNANNGFRQDNFLFWDASISSLPIKLAADHEPDKVPIFGKNRGNNFLLYDRSDFWQINRVRTGIFVPPAAAHEKINRRRRDQKQDSG